MGQDFEINEYGEIISHDKNHEEKSNNNWKIFVFILFIILIGAIALYFVKNSDTPNYHSYDTTDYVNEAPAYVEPTDVYSAEPTEPSVYADSSINSSNYYYTDYGYFEEGSYYYDYQEECYYYYDEYDNEYYYYNEHDDSYYYYDPHEDGFYYYIDGNRCYYRYNYCYNE